MRDQISQAFRPAALASVPVLVYFAAIHQTVTIDSRLVFGVVFAAAGVVWAVAMWVFGLSVEEKMRFVALVRRRSDAGRAS